MERDLFESLVRETHTALYRFAVRRVGAQDAPDVVAETYSVAWRKHEDVPEDAALVWLFAVAANVVRNQQRGDARRARLFDKLVRTTDPSQINYGSVLSHDDGERVRAALYRLRPADQEILRLIEWDELDYNSAAAVLGCTRQALRVRLHRARRRLSVELGRADAEIEKPLTVVSNARTHHDD